METRTRYGWQVIVGYLALIAFVLWVGLRNAVNSTTPLNDRMRAKRITHVDFKPSDETLEASA